MRVIALIPFLALLAGGCAARLPLEQGTSRARQETSLRPTTMPVSRERFAQSVERLSQADACFLRCAVERGCECRESEEELKRHEVGVFLGYTFERGDGGATIGLDYRYALNERFGVGPFFDYVAGEIDAFAAGAGLWIQPFREIEDLSFYVAPGIDLANEKAEGEHEGEGGRSWEAAALLRLGAVYGCDLGRGFRFVPSCYFDVIFPDKRAIASASRSPRSSDVAPAVQRKPGL